MWNKISYYRWSHQNIDKNECPLDVYTGNVENNTRKCIFNEVLSTYSCKCSDSNANCKRQVKNPVFWRSKEFR